MTDPMAELKAMQAALEALQPLDQDAQQRAIDWVASRLGLELSTASNESGDDDEGEDDPSEGVGRQAIGSRRQSGANLAPKEFVNEKRPKNNAERIACLGYYLAKHRDTPTFKTKEISELNTEAAGPRLGNAARDVTEAERSSGYLTSAGEGRKQMSV